MHAATTSRARPSMPSSQPSETLQNTSIFSSAPESQDMISGLVRPDVASRTTSAADTRPSMTLL